MKSNRIPTEKAAWLRGAVQFLPLYTPWLLLPLALGVGMCAQNLREQQASTPADAAKSSHEAVQAGIRAISLTSDEQYLDALQADGIWRRHDAHTGSELWRQSITKIPLLYPAIFGEGRQLVGKHKLTEQLVVLRGDTEVLNGDLPKQQPNETIQSVAWSPTGRSAAAVSDHGSLWLIECDDARIVEVKHHPLSLPLSFVTWSPDGRRLAIVAEDRDPRIWDLESSRLVGQLAANCGFAAWSRDSRRLITYAYGLATTVKVWNADTFTLVNESAADSQSVLAAALSPDGQLAAIGNANQIILWDVDRNEQGAALIHHEAPVTFLQFDQSGDTVFSVDAEGQLLRWRLADGRVIWQFATAGD